MDVLKHRAASVALRAGVSTGRASNVEAVRSVLRKIRPVSTRIPLVRAGDDGDGGYLIPDDLAGIKACFSPGVDNRATFEMSMVDRGISCFLADGSVEKAPVESPHIDFVSKFIGSVAAISAMTLESWVGDKAPGDGDLILQMDIEGAEWAVLLSVDKALLRRFRVLVVEFHNFDLLFDARSVGIVESVMDKLLEEFNVVHGHPNNYGGSVGLSGLDVPRVMELTFLRKDRGDVIGPVTNFPHPLDVKNDSTSIDVPVPTSWIGRDL